MITRGPNHPAITRGCLIILIVLVALFGLCVIFTAIPTAGAQCDTQALISGKAQPFANVRSTPNTTAGQTSRIYPADTAAPADRGLIDTGDKSLTWWHLCAGGWVRSDVVRVLTVTPQATPTRLGVAQTNIAVMTATAQSDKPFLYKICIDYFENGQGKTTCTIYPEVVSVSLEPVKP